MFAIIDVPLGSAEIFEQLGTKEKFWYVDSQLGRCLFKRGRPNTGENWAEKLACELAGVLGVPHAYYELAQYGEQLGVISPNFVPLYGRLVHGNELLAKSKPYRDAGDVRFYRSRAHTITLVFAYLKAVSQIKFLAPPIDFVPTDEIKSGMDVFVGYLMLDAWIGNQDRHDQNWGIVIAPSPEQPKIHLAPSFDHGSSLARNETDEACADMLRTRDMRRHISAYVERGRSALYPHSATDKTKSLLTIEAFAYALKQVPTAGREWLNRLELVDENRIRNIVDMLPDDLVSATRREFIATFLTLNRRRLLALAKAET